MSDRITDSIQLAHRALLLQRILDIVVKVAPDNMPLFQLKRVVDETLSTDIKEIDPQHLFTSLLTVGYAHLPTTKVRAAIERDIKTYKKSPLTNVP